MDKHTLVSIQFLWNWNASFDRFHWNEASFQLHAFHRFHTSSGVGWYRQGLRLFLYLLAMAHNRLLPGGSLSRITLESLGLVLGPWKKSLYVAVRCLKRNNLINLSLTIQTLKHGHTQRHVCPFHRWNRNLGLFRFLCVFIHAWLELILYISIVDPQDTTAYYYYY